MQQQSMNTFYLEFLSGELPRIEFEGMIYSYLISNQDKTCLSHWRQDDYYDYISWLYPRLHKSIDRYKNIGASFDAYLAKVIFISSKEYRARITSKEVTEYSAWSAQVQDFFVHEDNVPYMEKPNTTPKTKQETKSNKDLENVISNLIIDKKGRRNTRRILALIIKCYYYVSEDFAEKIAPKIGIDSNELIQMLRKIRAIRQKKDDEIFYMKERMYSQFFRCLVYERKLLLHEDEEKDSKYTKLKMQSEKARQRLERMRKRITSIRTEATNSQIAEIIGTSKGTVDASLHRLKIKWKSMARKAHLN